MNRKLLKELIVLITLTLGCTEVLAGSYRTSYITKWKNNADAALSLAFDDNGTGDNRKAAAAIMKEYGVHVTFNPITSYMKEEMFLDIFHQGHELGSHTVTHPPLNGASMETIIYELTESKEAIENLTGAPCVSYTAPYGQLDPNVIEVAQQLYISARGTGSGINAIARANMFNLKNGPVPPYWDDPNTNWSNQYYCERMREYLGQVIAAKGWGMQMFNGWTSRAEWNSGSVITETALRDYLSAITTDFASTLWVAPQGRVARYYFEREESTINTWTITDNVILMDLLFDGDKNIFNEPLTIATMIPEKWLSDELTVMQDGAQLDYTVDLYEVEPIAKIIISGDVSPDATGTYIKLPDDYNGKPSYKAEGKEYYIWSTGVQYYLSPGLGDYYADCWYSGGGESPIGTYHIDEPNTMGTPTATAVPGDEVPCLLYDAIPGGGTISIVFEPNRGGLDYGVSYLAKWKNNADAALSLTFDDNGTEGNRNSAAAILEEYGIHGTFNPITSYMNEEMFLDIFHRGHELGSHGVNHSRLIAVSMETIIYELTESKQAIENLTDSPCVSYTAPYGHTGHDIDIVAREIYLSARGVSMGINAIADANIFDLQIGPVPPYDDDPKTNWSNEEYGGKMREYLEQVIATKGWGIQMFHGWISRAEWNSGSLITDTALHNYLSEITTNLASTVWVAPQGVVARYYLEWQETTIEMLAVTEDAILLNLLFDGDKVIFDEPLTVVTVVPEHWLSGELAVMQRGSILDYYVEQHETEARLVYDAIPGGGVVAILFEPTYNQR